MITRVRHLDRLAWLFRTFPVVAILGARQVGKTTIARAFGERWHGPVTHLDLESAADVALLADPALALGPLQGLVILDEIQRRPELFPALRVLVDRPGSETKFLVLGSASPDLLHQSSESLAGRIGYHRLYGFALDEVGPAGLDRLWLRGGFPRSFLAPARRRASSGAAPFCRPSWNVISPSSGSAPRPRPCAASGQWWRTITPRRGMAPRSPAPSASGRAASAGISTS